MTLRIFCIVEGHGDVLAFPELIRRIAAVRFQVFDIQIERPYRLPKDKITRQRDLQSVLELGFDRLAERCTEEDQALIIVTRDADNDCPIEIAEAIQSICQQTTARQIAKVAVADEEFESWLFAGSDALRIHKDCRDDFSVPDDADAIAAPKGAFERLILKVGRSYSETVDQVKFAALIGLDDDAIGRSRSLRHLVGIIESALLA